MSRKTTAPGRADRDWMRRAACRDEPLKQFVNPDPDDVPKALRMCATCPVRRPCLETALSHPAEYDVGIWGGTLAETRQSIRRGWLTIDQALQHDPRQPDASAEVPRTSDGTRAPTIPQRSPETTETPEPARETAPKLPAPEITVAPDRNGDYTDATGRVIIFQLHGDPPWMLLIDRRPIARTQTVDDARHLAWIVLHDQGKERRAAPAATRFDAPAALDRRTAP